MDAKPLSGFHLGTLHGYFFHQDFWPNLSFPPKHQIKLILSGMSLMFNNNRKFNKIKLNLFQTQSGKEDISYNYIVDRNNETLDVLTFQISFNEGMIQ